MGGSTTWANPVFQIFSAVYKHPGANLNLTLAFIRKAASSATIFKRKCRTPDAKLPCSSNLRGQYPFRFQKQLHLNGCERISNPLDNRELQAKPLFSANLRVTRRTNPRYPLLFVTSYNTTSHRQGIERDTRALRLDNFFNVFTQLLLRPKFKKNVALRYDGLASNTETQIRPSR